MNNDTIHITAVPYQKYNMYKCVLEMVFLKYLVSKFDLIIAFNFILHLSHNLVYLYELVIN